MSVSNPKRVRGFAARATDEGIVLSVRTAVRDEHLAFPFDAVPEIVARLIAAHAEAAGAGNARLQTMLVEKAAVAADAAGGRVRLTLSPSERLSFPFSLAPATADQVAAELGQATQSLKDKE